MYAHNIPNPTKAARTMRGKKQQMTATQKEQHNNNDRITNRHQVKIKKEKLEATSMEIDEGHGSKEGKPTDTTDNPVPRNLEEDITV